MLPLAICSGTESLLTKTTTEAVIESNADHDEKHQLTDITSSNTIQSNDSKTLIGHENCTKLKSNEILTTVVNGHSTSHSARIVQISTNDNMKLSPNGNDSLPDLIKVCDHGLITSNSNTEGGNHYHTKSSSAEHKTKKILFTNGHTSEKQCNGTESVPLNIRLTVTKQQRKTVGNLPMANGSVKDVSSKINGQQTCRGTDISYNGRHLQNAILRDHVRLLQNCDNYVSFKTIMSTNDVEQSIYKNGHVSNGQFKKMEDSPSKNGGRGIYILN